MSQVSSNNIDSFNVVNNINLGTADETPRILAWLSPLEPRVRHHDIRTQRVENVGDWLLQTKEYRNWCNGSEKDGSDHAGLFCYGHPGVGKSFITSLVVDSLCARARGENIAVSCFYFDFASRKEQFPINMLGSLLKQLVSGLGKIPEEVVQEYREQRKVIGGQGLDISGIVEMFRAVSSTRLTFVCIDALDECVPEHRVEILDSLGRILQKSPNTRVFMTGRPHIKWEVETKLGGRATSLLITPAEHDIVMYLETKLEKDTTPEVMNNGLKEEIMKNIPKTTSETFLLVSLIIEEILRGTTISQRRKRLGAMADGLGLGLGLGNAYGLTLERIKAQDEAKSKLAMTTLIWICYSERPLKADELCHALAVEIGSTDFDSDNVPLISTLISFCQGLIMVDKEASTVRLIHHTLQEYLSSHHDLLPRAHPTIAETCLTYLNSQHVKVLSSHPLTYLGGVPFLKYASLYWGAHARREITDHVRLLSMEFLDQCENHISAKLLLETAAAPECSGDINGPSQFTGLHCASFFGIVKLVATLMERNSSDINKRDCLGVTPLVWAAVMGHIEVVKLLLECMDVDPNITNNLGQTALLCAASKGHEAVVKLLLEQQEVNPDKADSGGRTPLSWAARRGHEGVVKQLLEREEVSPAMPDKMGRTPFLWAAQKGHESVVKLLLEREEVNPDMPDKEGRTPLLWTAQKGHEGVVKLLLEREEVNPDVLEYKSRTPLAYAAACGHEGVTKLLLERGEVNPDMPDVWGRTPLSWAAIKGHGVVVKLLLEREEVNPDMPDTRGRTPLSWAAIRGHGVVVKLLLEREEVNPDMPDTKGVTPLSWAASKGREGVVKLILGREVNPDMQDQNGRTPLLRAAANGHEGVVKLLLERGGVNPDMLDKESSLSLAVRKGQEGAAKLLLEREEVNSDVPDNMSVRKSTFLPGA